MVPTHATSRALNQAMGPSPDATNKKGGGVRAGIRILPTRSIAYPKQKDNKETKVQTNTSILALTTSSEDRSEVPFLMAYLLTISAHETRIDRSGKNVDSPDFLWRSIGGPLFNGVPPNDFNTRNSSRSFRKQRRPARHTELSLRIDRRSLCVRTS